MPPVQPYQPRTIPAGLEPATSEPVRQRSYL
ncbi:hypothetical protein R3I93_019459 [Phoxinus phoxinus]|uniref:Uncharacterized protein n=1 Tax=Phoxinus phoxinus TaxID=58324 RepID=A0AAN9CBD9_9TELE